MKKEFLDLSDNDLKKNAYKYDEDQIIYTIKNSIPSLRILNKYQKISAYIAAKYVIFGGINEDNGDCVEDTYLDCYDILQYQPHLTIEDLQNAFEFVYAENDREEIERNEMSKNDL
jgi:hypothetical protein